MLQLPIWNLTDKLPAFYDLESGTAIEQTAKVYGAMRTLIDEYNEFATNINKEIAKFEASTDMDIDIFKTEIRQEFQDFIDIVNLKLMDIQTECENIVEWQEEQEKIVIETTQELFKNTVKQVNDRKFLFIGDSYAHPSQFTTKSWFEYVCEYLNLTEGVNAFRNSWGGTGFCSVGDGRTFSTLIQDFDGDKSIITDIVIVGGFNDQEYTSENLQYGINTVLNACLDYPNAKISYGMCGWSLDYDAHPILRDFNRRISELCIKNNIRILDDVYHALHLYYSNTDTLFATNVLEGGNFHPNEKGSEKIGYAIACNLLNSRTIFEIANVECEYVDNTVLGVDGIYSNAKHNTKNYKFYGTEFRSAENMPLVGGQEVKVCQLKNTCLCPNEEILIPVYCKVNGSVNGVSFLPCELRINNKNELFFILHNDVDYTSQYVIINFPQMLVGVDVFNS